MNIVYHYPPELFSLLVDTIPLLFRAKKDVILFFRGAGVNDSVLGDIHQKVEQDRQNINKYEIVRTILSRLNEKGEGTLRERREILKRVVEFENFATCWANDQLKAKGLVADIRKVVNVKDSFTRIQQIREQENKKRSDEQRAKIEAIQRKQAELDSIKADLFSLFTMPDGESQTRGKLLEAVLNRLFKANDILISEAFTRIGDDGEGIVEQIDGVIELDGHFYLVEMKWWKKPLGKSDVSPHLVNIFNRGHAGGILISASGYTDPAIAVCKDFLSKKVIVLCELQEIVFLLENQQSLKDFLKRKFTATVIDKNPFVKV